jgi:hypothetical protein
MKKPRPIEFECEACKGRGFPPVQQPEPLPRPPALIWMSPPTRPLRHATGDAREAVKALIVANGFLPGR